MCITRRLVRGIAGSIERQTSLTDRGPQEDLRAGQPLRIQKKVISQNSSQHVRFGTEQIDQPKGDQLKQSLACQIWSRLELSHLEQIEYIQRRIPYYLRLLICVVIFVFRKETQSLDFQTLLCQVQRQNSLLYSLLSLIYKYLGYKTKAILNTLLLLVSILILHLLSRSSYYLQEAR